MNTINNNSAYIKSLLLTVSDNKSKSQETNQSQMTYDSASISNTSKAMNKIDSFLNLGETNRFDLSDMNPAEKEEFYKMLAKLMEKGVVGYEIREVNGQPEKHFIVNEIGDQRLYGTKLYKKRYEK
jgi:hypothetical protein